MPLDWSCVEWSACMARAQWPWLMSHDGLLLRWRTGSAGRNLVVNSCRLWSLDLFKLQIICC